MITFYLDGFRGFDKTFLPLRDVNYFVGENSTGKTSVMAAIQTLSDPQCWLTSLFRSEYVELGGFGDIAPSGSEVFRLGFGVDGDPARAAMTVFGPGKGAPEAKVIDMLYGTRQVRLLRKDGGHFYHRVAAPRRVSASAVLESWAKRAPFDTEKVVRLTASIKRGKLMGIAAFAAAADDPSALVMEQRVFLENMLWMAPVRAKPRRSYDQYLGEYSPEGEHLPQLLEGILSTKKATQKQKAVARYGELSGLFKKLGVRRFGDDARSPYEISVDLGDLEATIFNVGYGVSQALPVVAEIVAQAKGTWFAIQQPEVHLHPRAQAAMGDLFFQMAGAPHDKRFIVETHSDYVVDRFRSAMRKATDAGKPVPSAQVVFFRREGGKNVLYPLELSPRGEYPEEQPRGFREFFLQEELKDLGY